MQEILWLKRYMILVAIYDCGRGSMPDQDSNQKQQRIPANTTPTTPLARSASGRQPRFWPGPVQDSNHASGFQQQPDSTKQIKEKHTGRQPPTQGLQTRFGSGPVQDSNHAVGLPNSRTPPTTINKQGCQPQNQGLQTRFWSGPVQDSHHAVGLPQKDSNESIKPNRTNRPGFRNLFTLIGHSVPGVKPDHPEEGIRDRCRLTGHGILGYSSR